MTKTTKILIQNHNARPEMAFANPDKLALKPSLGNTRTPVSRYTKFLMGQEKAVLESVVGYDDRQRITSTGEYPWCMICYLELSFPDGSKGLGTGWLLGKNKVLTAGHCVFNRRHGGWATAISVTPGNSVENPDVNASDYAPYGTYDAVAIQSTTEWVEDTNITLDVGVIHITDPIADELGNFGIQISDTGADLIEQYVRVSGYPGFRHPKNDDGTMSKVKAWGQMWSNSDVIVDVQDGRIKYQLDTTAGQSGAPVILLDNTDMGPIAVGIHNYGFNSAEPYHENKATLINDQIWAYIEGWLQEAY